MSRHGADVERCVMEFWGEIAKWPQRLRSMTHIFNTFLRVSVEFDADLVITIQICDELSYWQAKFPSI